ncbi:Rad3-like DNA repair helicase [Ordospora colligata]|uniref:DNA 5'-3' helicase n=1 Tax=Ordospora colligata OC4 TaxID=1354746 RepID=A0A0B2UJJ4_9MICR|nr:Rad3-like DNA repair helicase [Ordospora colligata OC4]KHN69523.1 Rad3-like DNA repair helicase [Ordospora colligata OC4]TBU15343.1 Rad3-like DNA repair helicase [Ordospora colligata]TBU15443.1 Rad3-like DNA repair helicase [Ordospora colligata]TBU18539.1 Rad3-like DNA repair helicase [Ordospora colligata]
MKITIDDVPVYFPYESVYPEQLKYMREIKRCLENKGHCLIEMPSGTGKTVALLSMTISYQLYMKEQNVSFKVIYCSRTVPEVEKTLRELDRVIEYIKTYRSISFLGLGLTGRRNLCINKAATKSFNIDLACRTFINKLVDSKCDFYENLEGFHEVPAAVYDFNQLKEMGERRGICPYYLVRRSIPACDCIVYTYNYLIDPRIYSIVSKELGPDCVVIFDEAHNIDSHCIEALSIEIKRNVLEGASRATKNLEALLIEKGDVADNMFSNVFNGKKREKLSEPISGTIPYFYASGECEYEYIPGNLRNSFHFMSVMKRITEFLKTKLKTMHLTTESTESFCKSIKELAFVEKKTLMFCSQRLGILCQALGVDDEDTAHLKTVAELSTMVSMYSKGFVVVFEPFDSQASTVFNPTLRLACLDSSIAMAPIFSKFRNVIITSGTLSPIDIYPKILNFAPSRTVEIGATLDRNSISPLIITKGNDQMTLRSFNDDGDGADHNHGDAMTTSFSLRSDPSVVRNYGHLVVELSKVVPDGMVCFFPSYMYMEEIVSLWAETNIINELSKNKLVFVETPDYKETEMALSKYKKACENGRGAMLFSVARGKVSEGVDFEDGYGRCVVMIGIPFQYTESVRLKKRLEFLRLEYGIKEYEFLTFDAMRHAAQCLGRVLRNKNDYGLMVLADERFERSDKKGKLPKWIQKRIEGGNCNLSVDMALAIARRFYREMAQECIATGSSLLSADDIQKFCFE